MVESSLFLYRKKSRIVFIVSHHGVLRIHRHQTQGHQEHEQIRRWRENEDSSPPNFPKDKAGRRWQHEARIPTEICRERDKRVMRCSSGHREAQGVCSGYMLELHPPLLGVYC